MQHDNRFDSIETAGEAIKRFILDNSESFKLKKVRQRRFSVVCKDAKCRFSVRASKSSKEVVSITVLKPRTCSPMVHYKNKQAHLVAYIIEHHRGSIIDPQFHEGRLAICGCSR